MTAVPLGDRSGSVVRTSGWVLVRRALVTSWRRFPGLSAGGAACGVVYGCSVAAFGYSVGLATDSVVAALPSGGRSKGWYVVLVCALLLLLGTTRFVLRLGRRVLANLLQFGMQRVSRAQVLDMVGDSTLRLSREVIGQVQSRVGADVDEAWVFLMVVPTAVALTVMTTVGIALLLSIDILLAVVGTTSFLLIAVASVVYQSQQERRTLVAQHLRGEVAAVTNEVVAKHSTIIGFAGEARHEEVFEKVNLSLRAARLDVGRVRSLFESLLDTVVPANTILILTAGVGLMDSGSVSGGDVVRAVFLTNLLFVPLRGLGPLLAELPRSESSLRRLVELLGVQPGTAGTERWDDDATPPGSVGAVELRGVTVAAGPDRVGVHEIEFVLEPGRPLVIDGRRSDGIDTLTALVCGEIVADAGEVVRRSDTGVRATGGPVVVVEEYPFILRATLRENVCLGARPSEASFLAALRRARLEECVRRLPLGVESVISEDGKSLSAGERQRVGIARALARNPGVIVLHGSTSSLDPVTERAVVGELANQSPPLAVMVISRRASDQMEFAEFLRLRDGRIVTGAP